MIRFILDITSTTNNIFVYLDNKKIGIIKPVFGGYQYFAKGSTKFTGNIFKTLQGVKDSLLKH